MTLIIITILFFLFFVVYTRRNKLWSISTYLVSVYLLSALSSLALFNISPDYREPGILATIVYCSCISLYFIPYFRKQPVIVEPRSSTFEKKIKNVGYPLSVAIIVATVLIVPLIFVVFSIGLSDARELATRGDSVFDGMDIGFSRYGIALLRWGSTLSYTILALFFYTYTYIPKGRCKLLKALLFVASLNGPAFGMLSAGRTNLFYWILFFGFLYFLFKDTWSEDKKKSINIVIFLLSGVIVLYVAVVTIDRFGDSSTGADGSIFEYSGQSYLLFCDFFENFEYHDITFRRLFPFITSLFEPTFVLRDYRLEILSKTGYDIGIFYTLLGDFFVDVGVFGMYLYSIVYMLVAKSFINKNRTINCSRLIILGVLYEIPLHGVFYYSLWRIEATVAVGCSLVIAYYLKEKNE